MEITFSTSEPKPAKKPEPKPVEPPLQPKMESDDEPMVPPPESPKPTKDNTTFDETVIVKEKEVPIRKEPKVSLSPVREGKWSNVVQQKVKSGLLWSFMRSVIPYF